MTDTSSGIPVGTPVVALNGESLGKVREVHAHYILIEQVGIHEDLDLPVDAIEEMRDEELHVSVNREALSKVDHEETVHRQDTDM